MLLLESTRGRVPPPTPPGLSVRSAAAELSQIGRGLFSGWLQIGRGLLHIGHESGAISITGEAKGEAFAGSVILRGFCHCRHCEEHRPSLCGCIHEAGRVRVAYKFAADH